MLMRNLPRRLPASCLLLIWLCACILPLVAAHSEPAGPIMACCKRNKANCCCRENPAERHSSQWKAGSSCGTDCRLGAGSLAKEASAGPTIGFVPASHLTPSTILNVAPQSEAGRILTSSLYQRPPPVL